MDNQNNRNSTHILARTAGLFYLLIIVSGLFSELFVRSQIILKNDLQATADNIMAMEHLFRLGFLSDFVMVLSDVGVAVLFFLLLKPVSYVISLLAAFFRLAQGTILGMNLLNYFMPLILLGKDDFANVFTDDQLNFLTLLFLEAHNYGYLISGVFFGISCILLGYLFFKSVFFPKWLSVLVFLAGISYLIDCFTNFLSPDHASISEILVLSVAVISELSLCLFLLIKGAHLNKSRKTRIIN